ncbi:2-dehydro-3-deoxygalactonokinase [Dongia mobilis]|uniref:2-dehydro-3-deoxygalactonokinase n=1 Tax=Dongia mobilis TaxID=578943 RepID=UPI001414D5F0|nr:2-dehydro-3-deoxygalactonokinase [Dongia mobilis]
MTISSWAASDRSDVEIACIAIDWGTSNRRGWALDAGGTVLERRGDDQGLLAVAAAGGNFAESLAAFAQGWLGAPVIMAGMVGSRAGWREAPYLETPARLADLAGSLITLPAVAGSEIRIVPGMAKRNRLQPDVMRGEECQLLGARLVRGIEDGLFLLPGTHAKWARVEAGRLVDFRTYMTGEIFGLMSRQGSLAQVVSGDSFDADAFQRGITRARETSAGGITHQLFGVRSLSLFGELTPANAGSYLSGLLIGTEMQDALSWARPARQVVAIGSAALLARYAAAAAFFDITLDRLESDAILPPALFALAKEAGLLRR